MEIGTYQASVLSTLFEQLPLSDPVDSLRFTLSGDFDGEFVVAGSELPNGDGYIAFNLPSHANTVFFALSDSGLERVGRILANLEDYERERDIVLQLGDVVVLPEDTAVSDLPFAVILLPTAVAHALSDVAHFQQIGGRPTHFCLAVPLSQAEYDLRQRQGHDALIDEFERTSKNLSFG